MMKNSLWLILLDKSGSMRSGFSSAHSSTSTGMVEKGGWERKIDAAKDLLCRRLGSLRTPDIAVIVFNSQSQLLFHCHVSEFHKFEGEINSIEPGGGTNLATAFNDIPNYINNFGFKHLYDYENIRVLVISDGLTDAKEAGNASQLFIQSLQTIQSHISVLLIDKTPEGDETAYLVATEDDVTYAESYEASAIATGLAAKSLLSVTIAKSAKQQRALFREYLAVQDKPTLSTISFLGSGQQEFNSQLLSSSILPTLRALEQIQSVSEPDGSKHQTQILSISQSSDIKASISGIAKAVEVIDERFTPWKRENAKVLAQLQMDKLSMEIRKLEAETVQQENVAFDRQHNNRIKRVEFRKARAEAEKIELENEKSRIQLQELELRQQLVGIASKMTKQLCRKLELSEIALMERQTRVLEALLKLSSTEHQIELINDESTDG